MIEFPGMIFWVLFDQLGPVSDRNLFRVQKKFKSILEVFVNRRKIYRRQRRSCQKRFRDKATSLIVISIGRIRLVLWKDRVQNIQFGQNLRDDLSKT